MARIACFLIVALICLGAAKLAPACSCVKADLSQHYAQAEHVFIARITGAYEVKKTHSAWAQQLDSKTNSWKRVKTTVSEDHVRGRFEAIEVFKGKPQTLRFLKSGYGGSDCGIPFVVGQTYLLFATADGHTSACNSRAINKYNVDDTAIVESLREFRRKAP